MKYLFAFSLFSCFLIACSSSNEDSLLNSFKITPRVNPYSGILTLRNTGVDIHYKGPSNFLGTTPTSESSSYRYYFYTPDEFQTIYYGMMPATAYNWNVVFHSNDEIVALGDQGPYGNTSITFLRSSNSGVSWDSMFSRANSFSEYYVGCSILSSNSGYFYIYSKPDTKVFSINGTGYSQIATINNYCVQNSFFSDQMNGFVIANGIDNVSPSTEPNTFFLKTTDGGHTWSSPYLVTNEALSRKFVVLSNQKIIVIPDSYLLFKYYFTSTNGGITWNKVTVQLDKSIRDICFVSDQIGYIKEGNAALWSQSNLGYVYRTTNGGNTWYKVSTKEVLGSKIVFYDALNGFLQDVLYGEGQTLYITHDGGISWKETLYPYDYITE